MLLTAGACWSVILSGNLSGRGAADDLNYHWVAIQEFARQLPSPDLSDYASATTPGYHLLLAPLVAAGIGHTGSQLVASGWTVALVGLCGWIASKRFGWGAVLVVLPLLSSVYVFYAGVWLLPDNAGWLGVLVMVLLALRTGPGWRVWLAAGVALLGVVWLRQVHIWTAAPVWLSAWLGSTGQFAVPPLRTDLPMRLGRAMLGFACTIPAFAMLAYFVLRWKGLVPPSFQDMHEGPNPATPGFILTRLAILSIFFAPVLVPTLRSLWSHNWRWIITATIGGALLGVLPPSSYSYAQGRYGGWWNVIGMLPTIADRSPFFILGSIVGAVSLTAWLGLASRRDIWVWLGVFAAFVLAQTANHASWQRYHEPMLLIMILLILTRSDRVGPMKARVLISSSIVAAVLGLVTVASLAGVNPLKTLPNVPEAAEAGKIEQLTQFGDLIPSAGVPLRPASRATAWGPHPQLSVNTLTLAADGRTITNIPDRSEWRSSGPHARHPERTSQ